MGTPRTTEIYQFKVTLIGITPTIWRRIHVPGDASLAHLHRALQVAMGWQDCHLYMFQLGSKTYGDPKTDDEGDLSLSDAKRARMGGVLAGVGAKFTYVYDYGDDWQHELLLEAIVMPDPAATYPRCVTGARRCPPEDAGGSHGYADYLEAMADPNHQQHEEMMMWRGCFDPEEFSVEKVNQELAKAFPSKPRAGSAPAIPTPTLPAKANRRSKTFITPIIPQKRRTPVPKHETVPLELNQRERDLILSHTFADESLTNRLRVLSQPGKSSVFRFTLDELDELAGDVAGEANHVKNRVLQVQLDRLYERIEAARSKYTDAGL